MKGGRLPPGAIGAAFIAGCSSPRAILSPAGPPARILAQLGWPLLVGSLVVSAIMAALIVWVGSRRPGSFAEHAPVSAGGGMRWVVIGGFVIPGIAFTAVYVATLGTLSAFPANHDDHAPAQIRVVGHQWWWEVEYLMGELPQRFKTANEIHIPSDRPVELELVSADVIHSFWVPRLHGKVDLIPGMVNHIELRASEPGTYSGSCAEFCGLQHAGMRFRVIVDSPAAFAAWLGRERSPAAGPADPQAARGETVFMNGACPVCHTVAGTGALATVGPNLTHVGSRGTIAAGWLSKDLATLHAWVVNAPSLKPGTQMPALTQFSGPDLHDLVAYLEGLK
ncbi:MAG TPA: cytochrome c oxidase subunit II [Polyangia bacterium]|nr:cytochrome c oxidase subunit II [Polyangia bacterium]